MIDFIKYCLLKAGIFLMFFMMFYICLGLVFALLHVWPDAYRIAVSIAVPRIVALGLVMLCLFGNAWVANQTAKKMTYDSKTFWTALKDTLYEGRVYFSFLPVLGGIFNPRDNEDSQDEDIRARAANRQHKDSRK